MIKACFFDFDDTLISSLPSHKEANRLALRDYGLDYDKIISTTDDGQFLGMRVIEILEALLKLAGPSGSQVDLQEITKKREEYFLDLVDINSISLPGAVDAVKLCKEKGIIVAIISSGIHRYIDAGTKMLGITEYIDFIVAGDEISKGKPDPECYLKAFEKASSLIKDLKKDECLVVEDAVKGVLSAYNAGIPVCYVPLYTQKGKPEAKYKIKDLTEFPKILG